jgi:hypothetical protein
MKNSSFLILVSFLSLLSCSKTDTSFYDKVLSDFGKNSYFIALDVKASSYKGRVIIQNNDLYGFLNKTRSWDSASYVTNMEKILIHRKALTIHNTDLSIWKFRQVKEINSVYLKAGKGVNSFIENYFEGKVLKSSIMEDEMNAVINQLFYWYIPARFDNLSGELLIGI